MAVTAETESPLTGNDDRTPSVSASLLEPDFDGEDLLSVDHDAAVGNSEVSTHPCSLTSSVVGLPHEDGRGLHTHKDDSYFLPNDKGEQNRLDMQHFIFRVALDDRLFLAPIHKDKLLQVLDMGCGTGIWPIQVADRYPQAQVLGVDISPIQSTYIPSNCRFVVDDCNVTWEFPQKFDLVHMRAMTMGINDIPAYLSNVLENLNRGGYVEWHEFMLPACCTEATSTPTPHLIEWSRLLIEAAKKIGKDFSFPEKMASLLQDAGFVNVKIHWQHWPVGPWAKGKKEKDIGRWFAEDTLEGVRNTKALFTKFLDWRSEEYDEYVSAISEEVRSGARHVWFPVCFAYAQKPS